MGQRSIRILVVDPKGTDFERINDLLALCGVFQYEVDHAVTWEGAVRSHNTRNYDCCFLDSKLMLSGVSVLATANGNALPTVILCEKTATELSEHFLLRDQITLGALLLSVSNAMRRSTRRYRKPEPVAASLAKALETVPAFA